MRHIDVVDAQDDVTSLKVRICRTSNEHPLNGERLLEVQAPLKTETPGCTQCVPVEVHGDFLCRARHFGSDVASSLLKSKVSVCRPLLDVFVLVELRGGGFVYIAPLACG
jgi:hypothetical protein